MSVNAPSSGSSSEADRLTALRRYDILDTPPEEAFDRITRLAADLFDAPISIINLIDEERQWLKSAQGFDRRETGRDISFCVHALDSDDVTVIEDTMQDERVAQNPLVTGAPGLRFYAGAPLVTPDGFRIGTLCVLDTEPRHPSDSILGQLKDLAAMVMDELELRRERMEVEEHRDMLQRSQAVAQVGSWEYDPATDTARGTEELYRIIGLPEDDFTLETGLDLYAPEARPKMEAAMEACLADGTPFDLEVGLIRPDGERREIRVRGAAKREDGDTVRVTGILQDVTEKRRMREALREREEYLSVTLHSIGDAVITTDPSGCVTEMNEVAERLTGWRQEQAESVPLDRVLSLHSARSDEPVESPVGEVLREGRVVSLSNHTVLTSQDGSEYQIADSAAPIRTDDGDLLGVVLVFRDVTEKYEREQELRHHRELLKQTQKLAGGWELDLRTVELHWTEEVYNIYGLPTDVEPSLELALHAFQGDARVRLEEALGAAINDGTACDLELPFYTADREKRWVPSGTRTWRTERS